MHLVSYNIRYGLGRDGKYNLGRITESVAGADIIALQEVERYWKRSGMVDQPQTIGELLPNYYWVYGPSFDADTSTRQEGGQIINCRRQFGTMLLSKTPILYSKLLLFSKIASTSCFNMQTGAIEGIVNTKIGPVRIYSLHLSALSERERIMQTEQLLAHHRSWQRTGGMWSGNDKIINNSWAEEEAMPIATANAILMGDFNTLPGSETHRLLSGHHELDYGRVSYIDEFVDSYSMVPDDQVNTPYTYWTDETERKNHMKQRLDYCFVSTQIAEFVQHTHADTKAEGSDHIPYWVEIDL